MAEPAKELAPAQARVAAARVAVASGWALARGPVQVVLVAAARAEEEPGTEAMVAGVAQAGRARAAARPVWAWGAGRELVSALGPEPERVQARVLELELELELELGLGLGLGLGLVRVQGQV